MACHLGRFDHITHDDRTGRRLVHCQLSGARKYSEWLSQSSDFGIPLADLSLANRHENIPCVAITYIAFVLFLTLAALSSPPHFVAFVAAKSHDDDPHLPSYSVQSPYSLFPCLHRMSEFVVSLSCFYQEFFFRC